MTRKSLILLTIAIMLAPLLFAGCKKGPVELTTPWPVADKERRAPRPDDLAVWPFTGERVADPDTLSRRPLSIKIENSAAARPQTGIAAADVVYETISEGGITRFNCIYHSDLPPQVGPVRSARLSDVWVVPQYQALFFFSGASASVTTAIANGDLPNLSEDVGITEPYVRSRTKPMPHNLFMEVPKAYSTAQTKGYSVTAEPTALQFEKRAEETTPTITEVSIPFSTSSYVRWVYQDGQYLRFNNDAAHKDAATGEQVSADNVVVLWTKHEVAGRDKVGSETFDINLGGKGRVSVFRNGQKYDGTWTGSPSAPPRFTDEEGRPIKLTKGRTWFQVIPLDVNITMK